MNNTIGGYMDGDMEGDAKAISKQLEFDNTIKSATKKAQTAVATAVTTAAGTTWAPIPLADMPVLIGIQVTMMTAICKIFNINIKENGIKTLVTTVIGASGASIIGKTTIISVFKFFPGVGSLLAGILCSSTAALLTAAIGFAFIEFCKKIKVGELTENDLTSKEGKEIFKKLFKNALKRERKKEEYKKMK